MHNNKILAAISTLVLLVAPVPSFAQQLLTLGAGGPSSTSVTYASDTLVDTPGTLLTAHTPQIGTSWVQQAGDTTQTTPIIDAAGTAAYGPGSSLGSVAISAVAPTADGYTEVSLFKESTLATNGVGITCRASSSTNTYYHARWNENGAVWQLLRIVGGTSTTLGSFTSTFAVNATHVLRLVCVGSSISVMEDGSTIIGPVTDTTIAAAGRAGLRFANQAQTSTTGIHASNFIAVAQ